MGIDKSLFLAGICDKYDERLLKGRIEIEGNVIGCLFSDVLSLDEVTLDKTMFLSKDGRFYYGLLNDLRKKGFNVIDEVSILSNSSEAVVDRFNELGGYETVRHMMDIINPSNIDVYLDQLYRENMLCSMYLDGFDLFKEKIIKDKKFVPLDLFRRMTCEQVLDYYETQLSGYEVGQSSKILEEGFIDFDDEWLEALKEGLENGVPFERSFDDINGNSINCFPFLSRNISGFLKGTTTALGGFSSAGKSTLWITILMSLAYSGEKIVILSNEERLTKFRLKFLVWCLAKYNRYYKLTKKKAMAGDIDSESNRQIKIARNFWRQNNLQERILFVAIEDADISVVSKKIREYTLKYGCSTYLYDTFKISAESMKDTRQDLSLVKDSRTLDKLAKKYNLIMLYSIQLAEAQKGRLWLDSSLLSNSKQIKEQLEGLFLLRNVFDEELDPSSKYYIRPYRLVKKGDVWTEEDYEADRSRVWKVLFLEKTRNGANSSDTNTAYLLSFDGDHAVFRETCMCRPRHGQII